MSHFAYRDGALFAEDVSLARIADRVGTPFYCYSTAALTENYLAFAHALADLNPLVCFALKANSNLAVIHTLARLGAGADVVSEGELRQALAAGVPADKAVFSGVGKTRAEMEFALSAGIGQFNVESAPELEALSQVAAEMGKTAIVALRVNPDVDAETHHKIATGRSEDKFGIDHRDAAALYGRGSGLPGIDMAGLAVHIGSQLTSLDPFRAAFRRVADLVRDLRQAGYGVCRLDLGGVVTDVVGATQHSQAPAQRAPFPVQVDQYCDDLGDGIRVDAAILWLGATAHGEQFWQTGHINGEFLGNRSFEIRPVQGIQQALEAAGARHLGGREQSSLWHVGKIRCSAVNHRVVQKSGNHHVLVRIGGQGRGCKGVQVQSQP